MGGAGGRPDGIGPIDAATTATGPHSGSCTVECHPAASGGATAPTADPARWSGGLSAAAG